MTNWKDTYLTIGHSPDPDDAFMFYAMVEEKIDLRGYHFRHILRDIETLNRQAVLGELHVSAISIHAYAHLRDQYLLLPIGASMGDGYGPLLITHHTLPVPSFSSADDCRKWLLNQRIAVPGQMTTAYLSTQIFLGEFKHIAVPFDEIFSAVKNGEADVGLLIHEGQLTYLRRGFKKILNLGEWWKSYTQLPLPLGGNVIRKDIPPFVQRDIVEILEESIRYGLQHPSTAIEHSLPYARGMGSELARQFIEMYVNDYTLGYGRKGHQAIERLFSEAHSRGIVSPLVVPRYALT
ncbi:MAG: ABC transporter substrate-binding protein [Candidatus Xiphinematobacter sp.]|nr:MAG: ABC transporter substrate-binding protein [Candidatus Xiphinematobacter sp.]